MAHHAPCLAEIKKLLDEIKKLKDENQRYLEALELSKSNLWYAMLELSAWMGIPEEKRQKKIKALYEEYIFTTDKALEGDE